MLAGGGLLTRYLIPRSTGKRHALVTAAAADIPANGALIFREKRVALMRNDQGIYALSLVCTHLGCTVVVSEDRLSCPCHGSLFDRRGEVVKGPADRALVRLELVEQNGAIEVYGS